jgi:hypothetical protein
MLWLAKQQGIKKRRKDNNSELWGHWYVLTRTLSTTLLLADSYILHPTICSTPAILSIERFAANIHSYCCQMIVILVHEEESQIQVEVWYLLLVCQYSYDSFIFSFILMVLWHCTLIIWYTIPLPHSACSSNYPYMALLPQKYSDEQW